MKTVQFGTIPVGPGQLPYVIAEIGSNHNGDMDLCFQMIDAAAEAGAHAVKFQSWSERTLIAREEYERNTSYSDTKKHFGSLHDMVVKYQFTPEQHVEALGHCRKRGIAFSSSAFSTDEVDLLDELDVPFIKIASMDINHFELLAHAARKGRPLVVSTGMATLGEIEAALSVVRGQRNDKSVLLHCVSIYPPEEDAIHLRNIAMLASAFDVPVGFSDHTLGTAIPLASVACGACVIEKHFTTDTNLPGWDHAISADPREMAEIVDGSRKVFRALGGHSRVVSAAEVEKRKKMRRSLVTRRALPAGHRIGEADLDAKRPGTGIAPDEMRYIVGRRLTAAVGEDQVLAWSDFE